MTFTPQEPGFIEMVREKISGNHFTNFIGFSIHTIDAGYIEGSLSLEQHHLQQMEFVHGGVTATVSDIVMGFAAFTLVKKGQGVVTVEMKVFLFQPRQRRYTPCYWARCQSWFSFAFLRKRIMGAQRQSTNTYCKRNCNNGLG